MKLLPAQVKIILPDQGHIGITHRDAEWQSLSVDEQNHNIFRLDAQGQVMWQIQRDELGKRDWAQMKKYDEEHGFPPRREPFIQLSLAYPDGSNNHKKQDGSPPAVATWTEGCRVIASALDGWAYELDIETGIARNITPVPHRPW